MKKVNLKTLRRFGRVWDLTVPSQRLRFAIRAMRHFGKRKDGEIYMGDWFAPKFEDEKICLACAGGAAAFYAFDGDGSSLDWCNERQKLLTQNNFNEIDSFEDSLDFARKQDWDSFLFLIINIEQDKATNISFSIMDDIHKELEGDEDATGDLETVCAMFSIAAKHLERLGL